jgi:predicted amidophosphoribosyltransferase
MIRIWNVLLWLTQPVSAVEDVATTPLLEPEHPLCSLCNQPLYLSEDDGDSICDGCAERHAEEILAQRKERECQFARSMGFTDGGQL